MPDDGEQQQGTHDSGRGVADQAEDRDAVPARRDARMDHSIEERTGGSAQAAKARFDKMLNTTTADSAARQILRAVLRNQRRVLVGPDAVFLDKVVRLLGSWYQPLTTYLAKKNMTS